MLINLRNALMAGKRLPYDAEVEYLESTGTQWIDTSEKIYDDTAVTATMYNDHSTESATYFFGSDSSTERFYFREYQGKASFSTGGWWKNTSISIVGTHTVAMTNNSITVDGVSSSRPQSSTSKTGAGKLLLFKAGTYAMTGGLRIYSFQIYQNGILVRDLIPVRKGTVGYLYDRVSGKLFGNAGTGDFVLGQDVVPVEYIESDGNAYINTGVIPTTTMETSMRAMITSTPTNVSIFGGTDISGSTSSTYAILRFQNNAYVCMVNYTNGISLTPPVGSWFDLVMNQSNTRNLLLNGVNLGTFTGSISFPSGNSIPMYVFCRNSVSGTYPFKEVRLANLSIADNGSTVRDYKAIRVGTEGAMMDVLTRRIYRNAGTGAFGYGNDLKYPIPAS